MIVVITTAGDTLSIWTAELALFSTAALAAVLNACVKLDSLEVPNQDSSHQGWNMFQIGESDWIETLSAGHHWRRNKPFSTDSTGS